MDLQCRLPTVQKPNNLLWMVICPVKVRCRAVTHRIKGPMSPVNIPTSDQPLVGGNMSLGGSNHPNNQSWVVICFVKVRYCVVSHLTKSEHWTIFLNGNLPREGQMTRGNPPHKGVIPLVNSPTNDQPFVSGNVPLDGPRQPVESPITKQHSVGGDSPI